MNMCLLNLGLKEESKRLQKNKIIFIRGKDNS